MPSLLLLHRPLQKASTDLARSRLVGAYCRFKAKKAVAKVAAAELQQILDKEEYEVEEHRLSFRILKLREKSDAA